MRSVMCKTFIAKSAVSGNRATLATADHKNLPKTHLATDFHRFLARQVTSCLICAFEGIHHAIELSTNEMYSPQLQ